MIRRAKSVKPYIAGDTIGNYVVSPVDLEVGLLSIRESCGCL